MILLLFLTVILSTIYDFPVFAKESCKTCSNLTNDMSVSSQSEIIRITREDPHPVPEDPLWGNPCNYFEGEWTYKDNDLHTTMAEYAHYALMEIATALLYLQNFRHEFVEGLYGVNRFETIEAKHKDKKWLQGMPWFKHYVLPLEKKMFVPLDSDFIERMMFGLYGTLPLIQKGAKMILSGLRTVSYNGICFEALEKNRKLRPIMDKITRQFRRMVCKFSDFMDRHTMRHEWMYTLEQPNLDKDGNTTFLIYRDAILYLEYIQQLFYKMYKIKY